MRKESLELTLAASKFSKEKKYWLQKLSGELQKTAISYDQKKKPGTVFQAKEKTKYRLKDESFKKLIHFSKGDDYALHIILMSVLCILLHKYTGNTDVIIGTPIYKQEPGAEGDFVNSILAIRANIQSSMTYKDVIMQVKQTLIEADENLNYPIELVLEQLNLQVIEESFPLFDIALLLENVHDRRYITINMNILFSFLRTDNCIHGYIEYNPSLYNHSTIERIISHFIRLLGNEISNIGMKLSEIEIKSKEEIKKLLYDFNGPPTAFHSDRMVHELFEEQVEKIPGQTALVYEDRVFTYQELNRKAGQLAVLLEKKGVKSRTIVGIMLERSLEMVLGIFGILKSGGAYLPIDPDYPQERVRYMLKDSGAVLLLSYCDAPGVFEDICETIDIYNPDVYGIKIRPLDKTITSGNLAHVIYTSGSTGKPKGVIISHGSMVNLIKGITDIIDFTSRDFMISLSTISFDIFGLETILPLTKGSGVVIGNREQQLNPRAAGIAMLCLDISILQVTPSRLSLLVEDEESKKALKLLKYLLVGGESFPESLLERLKRLTNCRIFNLYGPTETTVYSTLKDVSGEEILNIGKPICNTRIYIVDRDNRLQPEGVIGELCIAGDGISPGYINRPELTAEKYTDFAFGTHHSEFIYKTGDLACWLPDGNIEFLGRIDQQVKLRGFRIELEEIERILTKHEKIRESLVLLKGDGDESSYLCAYIVLESGNRDTLIHSVLREYVSQFLPYYMVPAYFVQIENIPLTSNGKADRRALPEPDMRPGASYVAPRDWIEERLVSVMQEVLGREKVGVRDDFFEIGGNSFIAVRAASLIEKAIGCKFEMRMIFLATKIEDLANLIKADIEKHERFMDRKAKYEAGRFKEEFKNLLEIKRFTIPLLNRDYCIWFSDAAEDELQPIMQNMCPQELFPHYILPKHCGSDSIHLTAGKQNDNQAATMTESEFSQLLSLETELPSLDRFMREYGSEINQAYESLNLQLKTLKSRTPYLCGYHPAWFARMFKKYKAMDSIPAYFYGKYGLNQKDMLKRVNLFIRNQSLLRSVLIKEKDKKTNWSIYYFIEYDDLTLSDIPVIDLTMFSPSVQSRLVPLVLKIAEKAIFSSDTLLERLLYNQALIKLNNTEYCLIFCFSHAISDHDNPNIVRNHFDVLNQSVLEGEFSLPEIQVEGYRKYIEMVKPEAEPDYEKFKNHEFYIHFKYLVQKIRKRYSIGKSIIFSDPYYLQLWPSARDEKYIDLSSNILEMYLFIVVQALSILFDLDEVPLRILRNRRRIGGINFYNTLGDFHDSIPVIFPIKKSLPATYFRRMQEMDNEFYEKGFNISNLGKDDEIQDIIFQCPFSTNFIGVISPHEEAARVSNANYFNFLPYPLTVYQQEEKLGFIFHHGMKHAAAKRLRIWLSQNFKDYRLDTIKKGYKFRYFREFIFKINKIREKFKVSITKYTPGGTQNQR